MAPFTLTAHFPFIVVGAGVAQNGDLGSRGCVLVVCSTCSCGGEISTCSSDGEILRRGVAHGGHFLWRQSPRLRASGFAFKPGGPAWRERAAGHTLPGAAPACGTVFGRGLSSRRIPFWGLPETPLAGEADSLGGGPARPCLPGELRSGERLRVTCGQISGRGCQERCLPHPSPTLPAATARSRPR
jgi:hypothetical protein